MGLFKDDAVAVIDTRDSKVLDTVTDRVVNSIDVGANPHGVAISGDGRHVLVSGWGSNRALVIDTATDGVIGEVPIAQPHNGILSRDGRTAGVASPRQGATALVGLDLTTWKEVRGLELRPDGGRVFFTLAGVNAIQVLDTATREVVTQIPVGASPHYAPFTPDGRLALAAVHGWRAGHRRQRRERGAVEAPHLARGDRRRAPPAARRDPRRARRPAL